MEELINQFPETPKMSVSINVPEQKELVNDEQIIKLCNRIADEIDEEKKEVNDAYNNFAEMVFNAGDATSASKEALVNLLKLKGDFIDKKSKLMDTMLKLRNQTSVKSITANQHNEITVIDKAKLVREMDKKEKDEKIQSLSTSS